MKKAAKVFIILGMIFQFYFIFPIIVGANAIKRLNNAKTVDELRGYGIASIICVSVLGGIFMLCVRQNELDSSYTPQISSTGYASDVDPSEKLTELKDLLDEGIIDKETYEEKRKKYVEDL